MNADWTVPALWFAVGVGLKATTILLMGVVFTLLLRRASAAARHTVWLVAIVGALVVPLLAIALPAWRLLPSSSARETNVARAPIVAVQSVRPHMVLEEQAVAEPTRTPWAGLALAIWLCGVVALVGRAVSSELRVRSIVRGSCPAPAEWTLAVERASASLGLRRPVRLALSSRIAVPAATGLFESVVLLPETACEWSDSHREAILLHELAHVRRRDCASQLLAAMACAIHWFNPLVWLAARSLRDERELAADDCVLHAGVRASDYAALLVDVARATPRRFAHATASFASPRSSHLERRVTSVLDDTRPRRATGRLIAVAAVGAATLAIAPLAAAGPDAVLESAPMHAIAPSPSTRESEPDTTVQNSAGVPTPTPTPTPTPVVHARPLSAPANDVSAPAASTARDSDPVVAALQDALSDEDQGVREQAAQSLRLIRITRGHLEDVMPDDGAPRSADDDSDHR